MVPMGEGQADERLVAKKESGVGDRIYPEADSRV